jgi:ribosomal-protein-alanine N-acetyltransferase
VKRFDHADRSAADGGLEVPTGRLLLRPLPSNAAAVLPGDRRAAAEAIGAALHDDWPLPDVLDLFPVVAVAPPDAPPFNVWIVIEAATNTVVGDVGFIGPPGASGIVEIGYSIVPARRRRGYARDATNALVVWAFEQPGVLSVVAGTDRDNIASQKVLEAVGFERTGSDGDEIRWRIDRPSDER